MFNRTQYIQAQDELVSSGQISEEEAQQNMLFLDIINSSQLLPFEQQKAGGIDNTWLSEAEDSYTLDLIQEQTEEQEREQRIQQRVSQYANAMSETPFAFDTEQSASETLSNIDPEFAEASRKALDYIVFQDPVLNSISAFCRFSAHQIERLYAEDDTPNFNAMEQAKNEGFSEEDISKFFSDIKHKCDYEYVKNGLTHEREMIAYGSSLPEPCKSLVPLLVSAITFGGTSKAISSLANFSRAVLSTSENATRVLNFCEQLTSAIPSNTLRMAGAGAVAGSAIGSAEYLSNYETQMEDIGKVVATCSLLGGAFGAVSGATKKITDFGNAVINAVKNSRSMTELTMAQKSLKETEYDSMINAFQQRQKSFQEQHPFASKLAEYIYKFPLLRTPYDIVAEGASDSAKRFTRALLDRVQRSSVESFFEVSAEMNGKIAILPFIRRTRDLFQTIEKHSRTIEEITGKSVAELTDRMVQYMELPEEIALLDEPIRTKFSTWLNEAKKTYGEFEQRSILYGQNQIDRREVLTPEGYEYIKKHGITFQSYQHVQENGMLKVDQYIGKRVWSPDAIDETAETKAEFLTMADIGLNVTYFKKVAERLEERKTKITSRTEEKIKQINAQREQRIKTLTKNIKEQEKIVELQGNKTARSFLIQSSRNISNWLQFVKNNTSNWQRIATSIGRPDLAEPKFILMEVKKLSRSLMQEHQNIRTQIRNEATQERQTLLRLLRNENKTIEKQKIENEIAKVSAKEQTKLQEADIDLLTDWLKFNSDIGITQEKLNAFMTKLEATYSKLAQKGENISGKTAERDYKVLSKIIDDVDKKVKDLHSKLTKGIEIIKLRADARIERLQSSAEQKLLQAEAKLQNYFGSEKRRAISKKQAEEIYNEITRVDTFKKRNSTYNNRDHPQQTTIMISSKATAYFQEHNTMEGFINYMRKWNGELQILEALSRTKTQFEMDNILSGKSFSLSENFGNIEDFIDNIVDKEQRAFYGAEYGNKFKHKVDREKKALRQIASLFDGTLYGKHCNLASTIAFGLQKYMFGMLLGKSVISALSDGQNIMLNHGMKAFLDAIFSKNMVTVIDGEVKKWSKDYIKKVLEPTAVGLDNSLKDFLIRDMPDLFDLNTHVTFAHKSAMKKFLQMGDKLAHGVFKFSGQQAFDQMMNHIEGWILLQELLEKPYLVGATKKEIANMIDTGVFSNEVLAYIDNTLTTMLDRPRVANIPSYAYSPIGRLMYTFQSWITAHTRNFVVPFLTSSSPHLHRAQALLWITSMKCLSTYIKTICNTGHAPNLSSQEDRNDFYKRVWNEGLDELIGQFAIVNDAYQVVSDVSQHKKTALEAVTSKRLPVVNWTNRILTGAIRSLNSYQETLKFLNQLKPNIWYLDATINNLLSE